MTSITLAARFSHGIFFLEGSAEAQFADIGEHIEITATSSGLTIPCQHEQFGITRLEIGYAAEVEKPTTAAFDGLLKTTDGEIRVTNVDTDVIARYPVPNGVTRIRVWLNRPQQPSVVTIGVD